MAPSGTATQASGSRDGGTGYWDEKIKRNMARDTAQNEALRAAGWQVIRVWDFEVEHDPDAVASEVTAALATLRARLSESQP
jgi:DNA mismatch endonuclease (patch repair protein)